MRICYFLISHRCIAFHFVVQDKPINLQYSHFSFEEKQNARLVKFLSSTKACGLRQLTALILNLLQISQM